MEELIKQEQFEIEVLDRLNTGKVLSSLVFGGGTMLRLCYGLDRFSVDLDFWGVTDLDVSRLCSMMKSCLGAYETSDAANKFYTLLFEIRSNRYPRALKIEVRKETKKVLAEPAIAFSRFSNIQVLLNAIPLGDMMASKIAALADRKEIRDAFDIEFLLKKGIRLQASAEQLKKAKQTVLSFGKHDYATKLGPLLNAGQRRYYSSENFKLLLMSMDEEIGR